MTAVAAYLLLFLAVGIGFIFVHLMAGKFIRPNKPDASKSTIYECGEPTIGSAWIQFDLRFYVIALLFVIFDVEVAFFFPWAVVFGKANAVAAVGQPTQAEHFHQTAERAMELVPPHLQSEREMQFKYQRLKNITPDNVARLHELSAKKKAASDGRLSQAEEGELEPLTSAEAMVTRTQEQASQLAWLALLEIAVFFGVLLVGFAYLWRRGDLAWVRSLAAEHPGIELASPLSPIPPAPIVRQPAPLAGAGAHS
ncbi:MAG TPA: NADH-quinone oxidoreductase subunit A [Gemmataceae bacterium]|nr:NADH-quinone oxidoreductase subunit A [Gemmataceae bacterium]